MRKRAYTIFVMLILVCMLFPSNAHAEPELIASFERWDVYAVRSIIDNSIERTFCVTQSKNNIRSNNSVKWALLFAEMSRNKDGRISIYVYIKFPEAHPNGSTAKVKTSESISAEWAVTENYVVFRNQTDPLKYLEQASDSKEIVVETRSKSGNIQYQAIFDMYGLAPAITKMLSFFL